jgi:prepilin-type N-terminal cleavage/methylation domain-containing protein
LLKTYKKENGFTLIEIIAILVILGILVATAVSRSTNFDAEVFTGADALENHLRYAQTMAMNHNPQAGETVWGISCDGSKYGLFQGTDTTNYIRLPDDEHYIDNDRTINLGRKKITVGSFTVFFDNYGIPYSSYTNSTTNTPLSASLTITVSGGSSSKNITVTPQTGFIP